MRRTPLQFHWVANIFSFLKVEECLGILIKRCMTLKDSTNFSSIWGIFQSCLNRKCKVKVGLSSFRPTLRWFSIYVQLQMVWYERELWLNIKLDAHCEGRQSETERRCISKAASSLLGSSLLYFTIFLLHSISKAAPSLNLEVLCCTTIRIHTAKYKIVLRPP